MLFPSVPCWFVADMFTKITESASFFNAFPNIFCQYFEFLNEHLQAIETRVLCFEPKMHKSTSQVVCEQRKGSMELPNGRSRGGFVEIWIGSSIFINI